MVQNCSACVAKFILFFLNFVFWFIGLALLALGIWSHFDPNFTNAWNSIANGELGSALPNLRSISLILIVVGAFILIFAFCGCCGAIRESRCLLGMYMLVISTLILLEITAVVLTIVFSSQIEPTLKASFTSDLIKNVGYNWINGKDEQNALTSFIFHIQYSHDCCGINNYEDYFAQSRYQNESSQTSCPKLPETCCLKTGGEWTKPIIDAKVKETCCTANKDSISGRYTKGCFVAVKELLQQNLRIIGIICASFIALQVVILISASGLCCAIKRDTKYY